MWLDISSITNGATARLCNCHCTTRCYNICKRASHLQHVCAGKGVENNMCRRASDMMHPPRPPPTPLSPPVQVVQRQRNLIVPCCPIQLAVKVCGAPPIIVSKQPNLLPSTPNCASLQSSLSKMFRWQRKLKCSNCHHSGCGGHFLLFCCHCFTQPRLYLSQELFIYTSRLTQVAEESSQADLIQNFILKTRMIRFWGHLQWKCRKLIFMR